ncbi:HEXXH motif domain-containing protein [Paractinoplanes hotanensis]|uniref:HEXXH motif domain-containing protein n=1 Tax=Paractinoplanes hotanensis TaxID=2906497 RepID=A0ABT0XXS2_9ACTN|nr:HEXXH motif domain-containing protein [Actinoplanes hotanensis]MCM4077914.1 HEXXH motif domain-containing protein [Actinoplanes hotanensis]
MGSDASHGIDLSYHRFPSDQLDELMSGAGGPEAIRTLWKGQRSRRMLLLDTVRRALSDPDDMGPLPPAALAWSAWAAADESDPDEGLALLLHPQVGSWAAYTLRRKRGRTQSGVDLWVDAGVVHTLALVANARSGRTWRTSVPVRDGMVMLPTLGLARVAHSSGPSLAVAECAGGEIRLRQGDRAVTIPAGSGREAAGWLPSRRLTGDADVTFSVTLDDLDPYRELADPVAPDPLDAASVDRWARLLNGAWRLLCRDYPEEAQAIAHGVVCLVPLPSDGAGVTRSASSGEAFGSVLMSPPVDEVDLAVSLIHEFQHIKLGGLLHLLPLTKYDGEPVHHAPWRDDPRPISGLLQGLYAFFGIAGFWRVRRYSSTGAYRRIVDFEFAYSWSQVHEVLTTLTRSDGLTGVGREIVAKLGNRVRDWRSEEVDTVAATAADVLCAAHRTEWRLRYVRPDRRQVELMAAAWRSGMPMTPSPLRTVVVADPMPRRWFLSQPAAARALVAGGPVVDPLEAALLSGDKGSAYEGFRRALAADPANPRIWAGLSLASADGLLRVRPEWVYAVCAELRARGEVADPVAVAHWLSSSAPSTFFPVVAEDSLDLDEVP